MSALDDVDSKLQAMEREMSALAGKFLCKPSNSSSTDSGGTLVPVFVYN